MRAAVAFGVLAVVVVAALAHADAPRAAAAPPAAAAIAGVEDPRRARNNFLLHCMGCHGENGAGFRGQVPSLRGPMAQFARSAEGRVYLKRVPGVTQTLLSPAAVAEVLNWALHEFNTAEDVAGIRPFTPAEIAAARSQPLLEVQQARAKLAAEY